MARQTKWRVTAPYRTRTPPERVKRRVRARIASLTRWVRFYEGLAKTAAPPIRPLARLKARELRAKLSEARALYDVLRTVGFDLSSFALVEVYQAVAVRGDGRVYVPRGLPEDLLDEYREAAAYFLYHNTTYGVHATGWPAFVDCDGAALEALKLLRPSDRVAVYAMVKFEDEEEYEDEYGRRKITDMLTVGLGVRRLGDVDVDELFAEAFTKASEVLGKMRPGARVTEVCVAVRAA